MSIYRTHCVLVSESMSQNGESWIWQMMQQDIQNKSKSEKPQRSVQGGVKHECEHCEYRAKTKEHLKIHTQGVHEGIRFPCNLCSYKATRIANLSSHKKHRHEGANYSCKECSHKYGSFVGLKNHTRSVHDGEKKSQKCTQCEYSCDKRSDIKKHIKRHGGI